MASLCHEPEVLNSLCRGGRLRPPRERSERGSRLGRRGIFLAPIQRHCALSRATPDEGVRGYTISRVPGVPCVPVCPLVKSSAGMTSGTRPLYP
jgi:hypothetical protein